MRLWRAIGRALLGPVLATLIGVIVGAVLLSAPVVLDGPGAAAPTWGQFGKGIFVLSLYGLVIGTPFALPLGILVWFVLDRYGWLDRINGAIAGGGVGLVVALPFFGLMGLLGGVAGAIAGWASVRITDAWVPRLSRRART